MSVYGICLGAAALYFFSRITGRDVEILKTVTRVNNLKDLVDLENKSFPLLVAVSGNVGSETPIKCEHSGILGAIIEETVQQHFLKRNWKFSWVQGTALMQPITKQVPWYLDDGTGRVNVAGAQDAVRFMLTFGSEVYEKPEPSSAVQGTLDYLRGLKMLGVRRIEHVLPIGTQLTVIGEAIKDGMGDIKIQEPEGGPFYALSMSLDQLISQLGKLSRWFKYASIGLTVVSVIVISMPVIECILERCSRLLLKRFCDATSAINRMEPLNICGKIRNAVAAAIKKIKPVTRGSERRHENSLDRRNRDTQVTDLCVICLEQKCNTAFVWCGHMCCCRRCFSLLQTNLCPICRAPIHQVLNIYRS